MSPRLMITGLAVGSLLLAGCGSNSDVGLGDVPLIPDLVPTDARQLDGAGLGGDVKFDVTISNKGGSGARSFRVNYTAFHVLDISIPPSACSPTVLGAQAFQEFDGLEAGDSLQTIIKLNLPPPYDPDSGNGFTGCVNDRSFVGTWFLQVTVDSDDDVIEADETNNVYIEYFEVSPSDHDSDDDTTVIEKPISN